MAAEGPFHSEAESIVSWHSNHQSCCWLPSGALEGLAVFDSSTGRLKGW